MEIKFSDNLKHFQAGIFNVLDEKKKELLAKGRKVYNLSVGTPDFEPDKHVVDALVKSASNPKEWVYSLGDLDELLEAVAFFYKERFNVTINKEQVTSVYGSQEGLAHIGLSLCNRGDKVLVPNPGYPIFEIGPFLSGADIVYYDLLPENNYLPDLDSIDKQILKDVKFMIISYPMNPVCKTAPSEFYDRIIQFAKDNNIIIVHDNAYADITYDGRKGDSILAHEGGSSVAVEFYSMSKSFNMTGSRISFLIGNEEIINSFKILRSQIDYGIFIPVQKAAIAALKGPKDSVELHRKEYENRRNALCGGLRRVGIDIEDSEGSMFAWAKIPKEYKTSTEFCVDLLEKTGVICTPGSAFGTLGEGYVRFALVLPVDKIEEAIKQIELNM